MRGRKPVSEFNHIMLEGSAREVQQQGPEIDFMDSDITVLAQQPGLGKTHAVIEFCENILRRRYCTNGMRIFG
jgi:hypothetical protein